MNFRLWVPILCAIVVFAMPMTTSASCDIDDNAEYRVFMDNVSIDFDPKPDGTEMTDKEKAKVLKEYMRRMNEEYGDGPMIMDILDGETTESGGGRRDLGAYIYQWKNGKLVRVWCTYCGSYSPRSGNKKKGKRRLIGDADADDAVADLPVRITIKSNPEPGSPDAALLSFANAKIAFDSTKDVCKMAKTDRKSAKEAVGAASSDLKIARADLRALKKERPGPENAIRKQSEKVRKLAKALRDRKDERNSANVAMKEKCGTCVPKARRSLSKARKGMAGLRLRKKYMTTIQAAIKQADKSNRKMRMQA